MLLYTDSPVLGQNARHKYCQLVIPSPPSTTSPTSSRPLETGVMAALTEEVVGLLITSSRIPCFNHS